MAALPRCPSTISGLRSPYACMCTAAALSNNNAVFGTDVYAATSNICRAARHAGAIGPNGGAVVINMLGVRPPTDGTPRNGIPGNKWFEPSASFAVSRYSQ